jgi:hypothetical protein
MEGQTRNSPGRTTLSSISRQLPSALARRQLLMQAPAASGLSHPQGIAGNNLHAATVTAAEPSGLVVAFLVRESDHVEPAKTDAR